MPSPGLVGRVERFKEAIERLKLIEISDLVSIRKTLSLKIPLKGTFTLP